MPVPAFDRSSRRMRASSSSSSGAGGASREETARSRAARAASRSASASLRAASSACVRVNCCSASWSSASLASIRASSSAVGSGAWLGLGWYRQVDRRRLSSFQLRFARDDRELPLAHRGLPRLQLRRAAPRARRRARRALPGRLRGRLDRDPADLRELLAPAPAPSPARRPRAARAPASGARAPRPPPGVAAAAPRAPTRRRRRRPRAGNPRSGSSSRWYSDPRLPSPDVPLPGRVSRSPRARRSGCGRARPGARPRAPAGGRRSP